MARGYILDSTENISTITESSFWQCWEWLPLLGLFHTAFISFVSELLALNGEDRAWVALWNHVGFYRLESLVHMWKRKLFFHNVLPVLFPLMLSISHGKWQGSACQFELLTFYHVCSRHLSPFGLPSIWILFLNMGESVIATRGGRKCPVAFNFPTENLTSLFVLTLPASRSVGLKICQTWDCASWVMT